MSISTVAQPTYEIREGRSSFAGGEFPFIEGLVDGQAVVNAFETPPDENGRSRWLLALYSDITALTGVPSPIAADISDAAEARKWVAILADLYAAKLAAAVDL